MIDINLRTHILSNISVDGVYALRLPQNFSGTAIVYDISNGFPEAQIGSMETVVRHAVTLNVYSSSYSTMRTVSTSLITLLNGMTGSMGTSEITGAHCETTLNTYEDEQKLYRNIINFNIYTN